MKHASLSPFLKEIISDEYTFFWEVYAGKYRLSRGLTRRHRPAHESLPSSHASHVTCRIRGKRNYAPFRQVPHLHRVFSNLSGENSILNFASTYGFLDYARCVFTRPSSGIEGALIREPLEKLRTEIASMKSMLLRWDFIKSGSDIALNRVVEWRDDGVYFTIGRRSELIAASDTEPYGRWLRQGKPLNEPAYHHIYNYVNSRLRGGVSPEVLPSYRRSLYLMPDSLLTAMWIMFMWELVGETKPRACAICGNWFNPQRSTRKTCGDRCRKRLSRTSTGSRVTAYPD